MPRLLDQGQGRPAAQAIHPPDLVAKALLLLAAAPLHIRVEARQRRLVLCLMSWSYIMIRPWPAPVGLLVKRLPRPTVCAEEWYTLLLLAICAAAPRRTRSWSCFSPPRRTTCGLPSAVFSIFIPFHDLHHLHALGGTVAGWAVLIHGVMHFARWATQNNLAFLWTHVTAGRRDLLVLTPLIVVPMRWARVRKKMRWELRKGLHYLSIPFVLDPLPRAALQDRVVPGDPVAIYAADMLGSLYRTFLVETTTFTRLEHAVQLTFKNPEGP